MKRTNCSPISKDDVERLSRGLSTRSRVGDIKVGHRLTKRERELLGRAKRDGYLGLPYSPIRDNVVNIYLKWCEATGTAPDIRYKGKPVAEAEPMGIREGTAPINRQN